MAEKKIEFATEPPKFVLMGAGFHICAFARILVEAGLPKPLILTYPKPQHERDRLQLSDPKLYSYVFDVAEELGLEVLESPRVNDSKLIETLKDKGCNAAFSLSCRSIIRQKFIDSFKGRVFNIHPSPLPKERGGGIYTWRVIQGGRHAVVTIHMIDEGIDTGAILSQKRSEISELRPVPRDLMLATNDLYVEALREFAAKLAGGERSFDIACQDDSDSTYLPRVCTEVNGAIDWSASLEELDRFIRGYSYPYGGAFSFVRGRRFSVMVAAPDGEGVHHPSLAGRVDRINPDGSVRVLVRDGFLKISKIAVEGKESSATSVLALMDVLHTPVGVLEEARSRVVGIKEMSSRLATEVPE